MTAGWGNLECCQLGCVAAQKHEKAAHICRVQLVTVQAGPILEQNVVTIVVLIHKY